MNIKPLSNCLSSFYRGQQGSRRTIVQHSSTILFHFIPALQNGHTITPELGSMEKENTSADPALDTTSASSHWNHLRIGTLKDVRGYKRHTSVCEDCKERSFKRRIVSETSYIVLIKDQEFSSFLRKFLYKNSWLASFKWQLTIRSAIDSWTDFPWNRYRRLKHGFLHFDMIEFVMFSTQKGYAR